MPKKAAGQSDLTINPGRTTVGTSGYGGPLHNWNGTLVTPEESNLSLIHI